MTFRGEDIIIAVMFLAAMFFFYKLITFKP